MDAPSVGPQRSLRWGTARTEITWLRVAVTLTFLTLAVYIASGQLSASAPRPLAPPQPLVAPRPVTVLLWWEPFRGRVKPNRRVPDCRRLYNISGCRLLTDRKDYWGAQAVIFHHRDLVYSKDWPPPRPEPGEKQEPQGARRKTTGSPPSMSSLPSRPPGQRWVWMNFESPSNSPGLKSLDGSLFNWTMSYRSDSDIFVPYGYLYPRSSPTDQPEGLVPQLDRKQGLVAWVVSHWSEGQARVKYFRKLSPYLKVDVFGHSGPGLPLPDSGLLDTVARYKFYLAFENSQHVDYITEKLWRNSFLAGAVPVVLGPSRANYERFVPGNAFIHVDDFPSPAALAAHLRFLDRNPNEYRRYFDWRRHYAVHVLSFSEEPWCRVCQALQNVGDQPKKKNNLAAWFQR